MINNKKHKYVKLNGISKEIAHKMAHSNKKIPWKTFINMLKHVK